MKLFYRLFGIAAILALSAISGAPQAAASESRTLSTWKAWEVRVVAFDNGDIACVAQVRPGRGTTFAIWARPGGKVQLQFFSQKWRFITSRRDVVARIDRRPGWRLNDADHYKNSVIFNLPTNGDARKFLLEVARGNSLQLHTASGRRMGTWPLAGSLRSMRTLADCTELL